MSKVVMPNLFVVGAAKAGTTSLWHILKQHPDIFVPPDEYMKEPCFFTRLTGVEDSEQYFGLFKGAQAHKYQAEVCTAYLSDPDAAKALHDFNPDAKIVVVLRNPVRRAYSLYNWMVQEGLEYSGSFERALDIEPTRCVKQIPNFMEPMYRYDFMYCSSGHYFEQVKRFIDLFGHDRVFIGLFEEFVSNQKTFMERLCLFLGVDSQFTYHADVKNRSVYVRRPWLAFWLRKLALAKIRLTRAMVYAITLKRPLAGNVEREIKRWVRLSWSKGKPPSLSKSTYSALRARYEEDYLKLEQAFGLELRGWRHMDEGASGQMGGTSQN